jgi:hypothetical protein
MVGMETFVVRVWRSAPGNDTGEATPPLRGFVEHAASGRRVRFTGAEQLLDFLNGAGGSDTATASSVAVPPGPSSAQSGR